MKNLLKVSSLSVLAVLCSANAWAAPEYNTLLKGEYFDVEEAGSNFYLTFSCVAGYYCPGAGYSCTLSHGCDRDEDIGDDDMHIGLVPCPDGTTSNAGAESVDECFAVGPTLYNDTISESCKVDFLGSSSGNALNSFAAEYTPNNYTVSLHSNYGTDTVLETVTATYDAAMPTASVPSRVGYTFNGFYDATTGGTQYYTSTMTSAKNYDKTANTNLYAYWDVNSHSITFSCGTMTGTIANGTATYDSTYTFPTDSACEHTGYTFNGWGCSNDTTYTSGQSLTWNVDSDLECSAEWTANTITVTWDPNNGQATSTNTCTYDGDITLPTAPTKTGYTFSGWKLVAGSTQAKCELITDYNQCESTPGCENDPQGEYGCMYTVDNCSSITDENQCQNGIEYSDDEYYGCKWDGGVCKRGRHRLE